MRKEEEKEKLNEGGMGGRSEIPKTPKSQRCVFTQESETSGKCLLFRRENPTNEIMRLICIERGGCRIGDMLEMTENKGGESFTQLCRFFM